jgi:hypothetical protein
MMEMCRRWETLLSADKLLVHIYDQYVPPIGDSPPLINHNTRLLILIVNHLISKYTPSLLRLHNTTSPILCFIIWPSARTAPHRTAPHRPGPARPGLILSPYYVPSTSTNVQYQGRSGCTSATRDHRRKLREQ